MKTEVCIIGAGPAGLMASIASARLGAKTTIIDSNTVAARKLLKTGRGRCNLTHTGSINEFLKAYNPFDKFLRHSLHEFSADDLVHFLSENGLQTKVEKDGCVFPITDRATDVARVIVDNARRLAVHFIYGKRVNSIKKDSGKFIIEFNDQRLIAKSVIIATGGVSWPFTGSDGDGFVFAKSFGHRIAEPKACLVRLITAETWPGKLEGVAVKNVVITAKIDNKRHCITGPIIFTEDRKSTRLNSSH